MPRTARKKSDTGIYHIMLRGINKQSIFLDREDNEKFLNIITECKKISGFELFAYCLMGNHSHLLIKEGSEPLGQVFKRIGVRFVYYFNMKYKRNGHLFQDRYKSEPIESESYLLTVLRYIHRNPVKARLAKSVEGYRWSSYNAYIKQDNSLVDTESVLELFDDDKQEALRQFREYNDKESHDKCLEMQEKKRILDDELIKIIEKKLKVRAFDIQAMPRDRMIDSIKKVAAIKGVSTRQIARVTGISANIIWQVSRAE